MTCFLIVETGGTVLPVHGPAWPGILRGAIGTDHLSATATPDGPYLIWSADPDYCKPERINVVGSLLGPQFGTVAESLYGPVVITHADAPTEPGEGGHELPEAEYLISLLADIRAAWRGEPVSDAIADSAWPDAIRLAGAWLSDPHAIATADLAPLEAVELAHELGYERSRR